MSLQSHASRHAVSEHLRDRHPPSSGAPGIGCSGGVSAAQTEIAEAYGHRCIPKLVAILERLSLPPGDRELALHVLNSQLANQEAKVEAIAAGAAGTLVALLLGVRSDGGGSSDNDSSRGTAKAGADEASGGSSRQQQLCCNAIEALCNLRQGRAAVAEKAGLHALAAALAAVPEAAASALKAFAGSADGVEWLQRSPVRVAPALVDSMGRPTTPLAACRDAAAVLAGLASTDAGVIDACASQVPTAAVALARRVLRFRLDARDGGCAGGGGEPLLVGVLREACACMRVICHQPDGKTQVREAGGIEALAAVLKAPGVTPELLLLAASTLASLAVDTAAKVPVMSHAGLALVALLKASAPAPPGAPAEGARAAAPTGADASAVAGAAAAALRLALDAPEARRKLEGLMTPQERCALLGRLPDTPPAYRYVVEIPTRI